MGEIHLSDAEWEIMNCLWNKPNQKISEIVIALSEKKVWDKHTVITLLNRMEKKGAVSFERNASLDLSAPHFQCHPKQSQ